MRLLMFAVYDKAVQAFLQPFFMRSRSEAVRSFRTAVNDPKTEFANNPSDFDLMCVGSFNDENGMCEGMSPERISGALELVEPVNGSVDLSPATERAIPLRR